MPPASFFQVTKTRADVLILTSVFPNYTETFAGMFLEFLLIPWITNVQIQRTVLFFPEIP